MAKADPCKDVAERIEKLSTALMLIHDLKAIMRGFVLETSDTMIMIRSVENKVRDMVKDALFEAFKHGCVKLG